MTNPIPGLSPHGYWQNGVGWWQDSAGTTPATGTNPIGRWDDQSGSGYHLIQATAGNRPTRVADSGFKAQPGVSFDGTLSQFLASATFQETSNVTAGTWVVAFQRPSLSRSQAIIVPHTTQVLGIYDSAGDLFFMEQFANSQFVSYRDRCYHGKAVVAVYNGTLPAAQRFRFRINQTDRPVATQSGAVDAVTPTVTAGLDMGRSNGASYLTGTILEAAYFPYALTTAQIQTVEAYWAATFFDEGKKKFHVLGDSIPFGYPFDTGNGLRWPDQLLGLLGAPWEEQVVALVAYMIAQMELSGGAIDGDRDEWRARDVVILECGTNDGVLAHTASQALADMAISVANRKARGFETIVQTLFYAYAPASGQPITQPEYESFRAAYNAGVLAGATGADQVLDMTTKPGLNQPINAAYFNGADNTHLVAPGAAYVASVYRDFLTGTTPPIPPGPAPATSSAAVLL